MSEKKKKGGKKKGGGPRSKSPTPKWDMKNLEQEEKKTSSQTVEKRGVVPLVKSAIQNAKVKLENIIQTYQQPVGPPPFSSSSSTPNVENEGEEEEVIIHQGGGSTAPIVEEEEEEDQIPPPQPNVNNLPLIIPPHVYKYGENIEGTDEDNTEIRGHIDAILNTPGLSENLKEYYGWLKGQLKMPYEA